MSDVINDEVTSAFVTMVDTGNAALDSLILKMFEAMTAGQSLASIFGGSSGGIAGFIGSLFGAGSSSTPTFSVGGAALTAPLS